jgi:hypothetical protein
MFEDKLKKEIKQDLVVYFDSIRVKLNNIFKDDENTQQLKDYLLNKMNQIFDSNCTDIDNYFDDNEQRLNYNDKEEIKSNVIRKYCAIILSTKNESIINKYGFVFVICDWYLTENHIEFIR